MLKELHVQNFALINRADIIFKNTFIVITGETGAGKSVLLDALSLALGGKADTSFVFDKSQKTIVEAIFDLSKQDLKEFFETNNLDYHHETILRREISADGKSRAFINDTPVTLSLLKTLSAYLLDIHSQHQNLILNTPSFRYNFVDAMANCLKERETYSHLFRQFQKERKDLEQLIQQQQTQQKEKDYLHYQLKELQEANLRAGELQQLEQEAQQLKHAESIIQQLNAATHLLQNADVNIFQLLSQTKNYLQSIARYHPKYDELAQRLQSSILEIKDITQEIETTLSAIEMNPQRIEQLNDRLDTINRLLKKHGAKTDTELLHIQSALEEKLLHIQNIDALIEEKKQHITRAEKELKNKAQQLSAKRQAVKTKIETECTQLLKELNMPNAQFIVNIQPLSANEFNEFGTDNIEFLFSANKGIAPAEVQKTASGGEIARLMLTIKSMMAKHIQLPAIIFDEIDTGVSGYVAAKMGDIMKRMSHYMQVIVITHLPQIAAKGTQHLYVSKEEQTHKTISKITELTKEQRLLEIAKMLSNDNPSEAAIQNAKELLMN